VSTITQPLDHFQVRDAVAKLVGSDIYRGLVAKHRAEAGRRRAELLAELPVGADAERKAIDSAGKARWRAAAAAEQAEAALSAAKAEAHAAFLRVESLTSQAHRRVDRITAELRELADGRIAELRDHIEALHERARLAAKPVRERVVPDLTGRDRQVFDWNTDDVDRVRATLRGLIAECDALVLADYGGDVGPRLRDILARGEAAADTLDLYGDDAGGRRLARHHIGA